MTKTAIQLGDKVKDKVTGFTGIAVARITYLNGCDRIEVKPPVDKDGKWVDSIYMDVMQLEVVKRGVVKGEIHETTEVAAPKRKTGGPSTRSPSKG